MSMETGAVQATLRTRLERMENLSNSIEAASNRIDGVVSGIAGQEPANVSPSSPDAEDATVFGIFDSQLSTLNRQADRLAGLADRLESLLG